MNINLIDTLLDNPAFIDTDTKKVLSDVSFSQVMTQSVPSGEKSEYVILTSYLDQQATMNSSGRYSGIFPSGRTYTHYDNPRTTRYSDQWKTMGLERLVISKKLLEFFMHNSDIYTIKKIFSMSPDIFRGHTKDISIQAYAMIVNKFNHLREDQEGYLLYGEKGIRIRYGKFVNMINEMFHAEDKSYAHYRVKEVEKSVDHYKSKFNTSDYKICVLTGKDILYGYNRDYQAYRGDTVLHQSCMNGKNSYLKLYTKNKKKIHLLVITDKNDKIISRNIMWRLSKYNNFLFDRVYSADNFIGNSVRDLANSENWIMRNGTASIDSIKKIDEDGKVESVPGATIKIKLKNTKFLRYPYLDTMLYQRFLSKTLTNRNHRKFVWCYNSTHGTRRLKLW